ncbi:RluA family pseudouridine synthase [Shewanella intestini]|uniref:RluA family pseudouridine synthase n=1 Tax=Shewanella intestini TaxID=2017544 RepID=A0ABS5HYX8_9GAMM|nr:MULTISPECIES: RluA family pseudouridine synthase [Shewanella]MBR9726988.1 RluA family pseudouridine synthase [Shewanella intestini]MRG34446.1 RluA family pseudouridine synthase [Shewanella sp. XMDDZSB0408]
MPEFIAPPCYAQITIIFEDEHLFIINKPSGLLSLSGKNPANLDSVHYRLVQDYPSCTLVHRLDFGTSGILLVAKNKLINGQLTKQFQDGLVTKTYTAILLGKLTSQQGDIHFPIAKDKNNFPYMKICFETGKAAHSHYRVIESLMHNGMPTTKVIFTPITGRTHQLRIHSQQINHPIIGCDLYTQAGSHALASRLMLHATSLSFIHPVTKQKMDITCPSPF